MDSEAHPEEALDRALRGELSRTEQRALEEHLAACSACEAHLALARAQEKLQPWGSRLNSLAVDYALAHFGRARWPALFFWPPRRRWLLATAGMLMGLASVASAALWYRQAPAPDQGPPQATMVRPAARKPVAPPGPAIALSEAPSFEQAELIDERPSLPREPRVQLSATLLFEQASHLRDRNRVDEAIAVFRKLQQLFPKTRESRISFAVAGRMLLDRGRPAQALAQFDQHLAYAGEASQEALAGRATALGQMGRLSAERETWQRLLDSYPGTVYASQARERLSQMRRLPEAVPGIEHSR
jgi:tetratricopeptide (TPR) repeat protein